MDDEKERPFACHLCPKTYLEKGSLTVHIKSIHLKLRDQKCEQCGKGFSVKRKLNYHIAMVHDKVRNFPCDLCIRRFRAKGELNRHKDIVHFGKLKYVCENCDKAFGQIGQLKRHMKWHHSGTRFNCDKCEKEFHLKKDYWDHVRADHPNPNATLLCPLCGCMVSKNGLSKHMKIFHEKSKPKGFVICELCGKALGSKSNLKYHIEKVHPNGKVEEAELVFTAIDEKYNHMASQTKWETSDSIPDDKNLKIQNCSTTAGNASIQSIIPSQPTSQSNNELHQPWQPNQANMEHPHNTFSAVIGYHKNSHIQKYSLPSDDDPDDPDDPAVSFSEVESMSTGPDTSPRPSTSKVDVSQRSKEYLQYYVGHQDPSSEIQKACKNVTAKATPKKRRYQSSKYLKRYLEKCPVCGHSFLTQENLTRHMKSHMEVHRPFSCDQCPKSFAEEDSLKRHVAALHTTKHLKEAKAVQGSSTVEEERMKNLQEAMKLTRCSQCPRTFEKPFQLRKHVESVHEKIKAHKCHICERAFYEASVLRTHIKRVHDRSRDFPCPQCDKAFTVLKARNLHIKTVHNKTGSFVQCHVCDAKLRDNATLFRHLAAVHEQRRDHKCDKCEKTFAHSTSLHRHKRLEHDTEKAWKCSECGKIFGTSREFKNHFDQRHGDCEFKCGTCGMGFRYEKQLKSHEVEHGDIVLFCEICGKQFHKRTNLTMHMRRKHSAEKLEGSEEEEDCPIKIKRMARFKCEDCAQKFASKRSYQNHVNKVHKNLMEDKDKEELKCHYCDKKFTRRTSLKKHVVECSGGNEKDEKEKSDNDMEFQIKVEPFDQDLEEVDHDFVVKNESPLKMEAADETDEFKPKSYFVLEDEAEANEDSVLKVE